MYNVYLSSGSNVHSLLPLPWSRRNTCLPSYCLLPILLTSWSPPTLASWLSSPHSHHPPWPPWTKEPLSPTGTAVLKLQAHFLLPSAHPQSPWGKWEDAWAVGHPHPETKWQPSENLALTGGVLAMLLVTSGANVIRAYWISVSDFFLRGLKFVKRDLPQAGIWSINRATV